ncbi:MAG: Flp pilus assembly protein CpaB [Pacificimonas sp.]
MDIKKVMLLVGALVIALGAAFGIRILLGSGATPVAQAVPVVQQAEPDGPKVLVAQTTLSMGTIVRPEHFSYQPWPQDLVENAYFLEGTGVQMDDLLGKVARIAIPAGQPITKPSLVGPGDRGFLAAALQPGMRAVTVPINNISGVAGFIFPGDRVDVLLTHNIGEGGETEQRTQANQFKVAETIVRNVRILAVDQRLESLENSAQKASTVTFEVPPKMVEKIAVAQTLGKLSLSLRSLMENRAQLEQAIADGSIEVGDDQSTSEDAAMEIAAQVLPDDSGSTFTTGGEVSRFALDQDGRARIAGSKKTPEGNIVEPPKVRVVRGRAKAQVITVETPNGNVEMPMPTPADVAAFQAARNEINETGGQ